ncbi:unnamed protein product [Rhizophagus irregularis]|uniref:RhoGAP-domain-containing protein n=1 Tax=Rhizophagus irregularis TaxID=588596 RepID=A0A2N1P4B9_9GLOM|nr:hypothetical protein RhiirC2_723234 [Rhizophagus irregularis]CAB4376882.1 unnamed protein product [Rhizophagus irregularis]CAB5387854.1 unnamed protein product [Rhizophagus irregularis]
MATVITDSWVQIRDPQLDTVFYANPSTGECLLEKPRNVSLHPVLGIEWWELWDDNHNLPYYYNTTNGQTGWDLPSTGTIIPLKKIQNSSIGKRLSVVFAQDDDTIIDIGKDSKQRASGLLLSPNHHHNHNHQHVVPPLKNYNNQQDDFVFHNNNNINHNNHITINNNDDYKNSTMNTSENTNKNTTNNTTNNTTINSTNNSSNNTPNNIPNNITNNTINNTVNHTTNNTIITTTPASPIKSSSRDVDLKIDHSKNSLNSSNTLINDNNNDKSSQGQVKLSESQNSSTSTSASRPITPPNAVNNGIESYVNMQQQSFKIIPPNKSLIAADKARKTGISNPVVNFDAATAMKPTGNLYQDLQRKKPAYKIHTRKLSTGEVITLPPELQEDISKFRIDGFARKYFTTHKKGIFRRKVPVEKMLLFQKDLISQPLMTLNTNIQKDAIKCFKVIQRIMGDRSKGRNGPINVLEDIQWLLDRGISHGELRDEIYVQICKQLNENPHSESIRKGWELLCVIAVTFPPSKNFEAYLMQFIMEHFTYANQIDILSKHVHNRLTKICKRGPRGKVLTLSEIERAREAPFHPSVFGETLEFIMNLQAKSFPHLKIPRILPFLSNSILELNGQSSEGIFRVPGDADYVTELKLRIEKNRYDMSGITDPNVPSSLLKLWLRDLAEPLIPNKFYEKCIRYSEDARAVEIVKQLPLINQRVVVYTIDFLQKFANPQIAKMTKMNVHNLAMVFAPNFLRCPSENLAVIFENTKYEQAFLRTLLLNLNSIDFFDDDENLSISSNKNYGKDESYNRQYNGNHRMNGNHKLKEYNNSENGNNNNDENGGGQQLS